MTEVDFDLDLESADDDLILDESVEDDGGDDDDIDFEQEDDVDDDDFIESTEETGESAELLGSMIFPALWNRRSRRRRRSFSAPQARRGIKSAILRTPSGSARLRLPRASLPVSTFNRAMRVVNNRLNRLDSSVKSVNAGLRRTQKESRRVSIQTRKAIAKANRRTAARISRASSNSMMMTMIMMSQLQRRITAEHGPSSSGGNNMAMAMMMMAMMGTGKSGSSGMSSIFPMMIAMNGFGSSN